MFGKRNIVVVLIEILLVLSVVGALGNLGFLIIKKTTNGATHHETRH